MALIVEDGSNVTGADCYASLDDCIAYAVAVYGSSLNGNTADKEAAIRRAVNYLDGIKWKGTRTNGRSQSLAWPRADMVDADGNDIANDEIPSELIKAQHELARAEFISPGVLSPQLSQRDAAVTSEKVGEISVSYSDKVALSAEAYQLAQVQVEAALRYIRQFLVNGGRVGVRTFDARVV